MGERFKRGGRKLEILAGKVALIWSVNVTIATIETIVSKVTIANWRRKTRDCPRKTRGGS